MVILCYKYQFSTNINQVSNVIIEQTHWTTILELLNIEGFYTGLYMAMILYDLGKTSYTKTMTLCWRNGSWLVFRRILSFGLNWMSLLKSEITFRNLEMILVLFHLSLWHEPSCTHGFGSISDYIWVIQACFSSIKMLRKKNNQWL